MKEFSLEEAKAGKPVCTKDGRPARIICFDRKSTDFPIVVLIDNGTIEDYYCFTNNGTYHLDDSHHFDLMMAPVKRKGWINIYKQSSPYDISERLGSHIYSTQEQALAGVDSTNPNYIATIEIEWEEQP